MACIELYEGVHTAPKTLSVMALATFGHFICLATYIVLGVAQYEHTINASVHIVRLQKHQRPVFGPLEVETNRSDKLHSVNEP